MIKGIFIFLAIFIFNLFAQPCPCCPKLKERSEPPSPKQKETIEHMWLSRLTEELALSEEETSKIFPKFRKIRELKENRKKEREKEIEKLTELLTKKVDEELKTQINLIIENDKRNQEEIEKIEKEILTLLTPYKQAKYLIFHAHFRKMLRCKEKRLKRCE